MPNNETLGGNNQPQLQSSLGRVSSNSTKKDRTWNDGYLALGKVLKVHHKRYTADVAIYGSSDVIMSDTKLEGKYACRIAVNSAGVDEEFREPYGEIIPIHKNMIVLVAFLKNSKEKPVIIKAFHNIDESTGAKNYDNILPSEYPINFEKIGTAEMYRYTNINRVQDVFTIDGVGNMEISSHTKSFFLASVDEVDGENFDYEDLHTKNKRDGKTVYIPEVKSYPLKYLAVFRDSYRDNETNWLRLFIDAIKTSFRMVKVQREDKMLTSINLDENGAFTVRRQLDSEKWDSGEEYVETVTTETGDIEITRKKSGKTTTIIVNNDGVSVKTEDNIEMESDKSIKLKCKNTTIEAKPSELNLKSAKINLN